MEKLNLHILTEDIAEEVGRVFDRRFGSILMPRGPRTPDFEPRNLAMDTACEVQSTVFEGFSNAGLTVDDYSETNVELDSVRGELAEITAEDSSDASTNDGIEAESEGANNE